MTGKLLLLEDPQTSVVCFCLTSLPHHLVVTCHSVYVSWITHYFQVNYVYLYHYIIAVEISTAFDQKIWIPFL